jgi:hypothetical protein
MPTTFIQLTDTLSNANIQYWLTVFFGLVIIYSYAVGKYDSPTYAKTSIGNLAQLSPRSLAPDSRYRKGFRIYVLGLFGIYFILCTIGPKIFTAFGLPVAEYLKDPSIWPIGVASAVTAAGAVSDNKFPGNIEGLIRRKAHEAAYIPTAVTTLAYQLRSLSLTDWLDRASPSDLQTVQLRVGDGPALALQEIAKLEEGKLVSWARANILFLCYQQLEVAKYGPFKAQDESRQGEEYLVGLHASVRSRLASVDLSNLSLDDALSKQVDGLFEGASVLLASTLLQATPDARELSSTIFALDFKDIDAAGRQTWQQYATFVMSVICVVCAVFGVVFYLFPAIIFGIGSAIFPSLKGLELNHIQNYTARITQPGLSSAVLYISMFCIMVYVRERRLSNKKWEEKLGTYVDFWFWTSIFAALVATVITLAVPYVRGEGLVFILAFALPLSVLGSIFFVFHMRGSARCPDNVGARLLHIFGPGTIAHALMAVLLTGVLTTLFQRVSFENAPVWSMADVGSYYRKVADKLKQQENVKPGSFTGRHSSQSMMAVKDQISSLAQEFERSTHPITPNIANNMLVKVQRICALLDDPFPLESKLFIPPNEDVQGCRVDNTYENPDALTNAADRDVVSLGRNLEALWSSLWAMQSKERSEQIIWVQVTIACLFGLCTSLAFSSTIRFGRVEQLRNQIDKFDENTLEKLTSRAKTHFSQRGADTDTKVWQSTPNTSVGLLTPLEAVRYQPYRPPLFDSLPIKTEPKRSGKGAQAGSADRRMSQTTVVPLRG